MSDQKVLLKNKRRKQAAIKSDGLKVSKKMQAQQEAILNYMNRGKEYNWMIFVHCRD
ncbi:MAG: hypothetical protein LUG99_18695 [Lachnospiraceae bacterium]|nr:hypothetical protein [Lachnospiraceae bacterium]